jgi:hypothetical protein
MSTGGPRRSSISSRLFRIAAILLAHSFALFLVLMVLVIIVATGA